MNCPRTYAISRLLLPFVAAAMLLGFALPVCATTLEAYTARVDYAAELAADTEQALTAADQFERSISSELVDQVRLDFPSSERVEWSGGSVEISNEWLLARIAELDEATDLKQSLPAVAAIREHLAALSYKLHELENPAAAARTKDEDKQKLAEILRREEYQRPEQTDETAFQRMLSEFVQWLTSFWPAPPAPAAAPSGMESVAFVLRIVLYAGLAVLLAFLVFKIAPRLFPHLRRAGKPRSKRRIILGEEIQEDEAAADLFSQAERLAREGDLRGAIRKGYIALLCDLSDRRILGLARHKTNRDYVADVRSRRDLHARMRSVTEMFERHWYGSQRSEAQDWQRFSEEYYAAIRSV
jgi:hypothetical protein